MTSREQELIEQIRQAFDGVRLDDGISLNMTEYNDSSGCMPEFKVKAQNDERDDWAVIPDETLEQFTVTFSFTDLKGFRFYIPAYMIWAIRNHRTSDSIISDFTIYAIDPSHHLFKTISFLKWFTAAQVSAMKAFLEYAVENDGTMDGRVAAENLGKIRSLQQNDPFGLLIDCLKKDGLSDEAAKLHVLRYEMAWTTGTELTGEFGQAMAGMRKAVKRGSSAETKEAWRASAKVIRNAWPGFWSWFYLRM
jgi:hypothetical protein